MKYRLINTGTDEEHLCDKITIEGFDYYVGNNNIEEIYPQLVIEKLIDSTYCITQIDTINDIDKETQRRIVATNNLSLNIPKVVDEVEKLAWDVILNKSNILESEQQIAFTAWYDGYKKSQETYSFSEEDVIEFGDWLNQNASRNNVGTWGYFKNLFYDFTTQELLQRWKEQRPKIVYYA